MEDWLGTLIPVILSAAFTAGAIYAAVRRDLESHDNRLNDLEERELEDKFVTRREFEQTLKFLRGDINSVKETQAEMRGDVRAIRDHLLSQGETGLE